MFEVAECLIVRVGLSEDGVFALPKGLGVRLISEVASELLWIRHANPATQ